MIKISSNEKPHSYAALLRADRRSGELYPLTKDFPLGLLPIGNKKIIVYQLQSLASVKDLERIFIAVDSNTSTIQQFIQKQFLIAHSAFPCKISFIQVNDQQTNFSSFQETVEKIGNNYKGIIIMPCDIISAISVTKLIEKHQSNNNDCTLLLKSAKQLSQNQKKNEAQIETQIDLALLGDNGQVLSLDSLDQYEQLGFKVNSSIYQQVKKAYLRKVVDSKIYIMNQKIVQIIIEIKSQELIQVKPHFISMLIKNQTNKNLLNYISEQNKIPLKINAFLAGPDQYIKRIHSLKVYQTLNLDSLIRSAKKKEVLLPNQYTIPHSNKFDFQKYNTLIGQQAIIGQGFKPRRSCIQNYCQIGNNTEIINSIILQGAKIGDNCKITQCVVGAQTRIGEGSILKGCQLAWKARVIDGSKKQNQFIIPID